jgi:hypothetical protein
MGDEDCDRGSEGIDVKYSVHCVYLQSPFFVLFVEKVPKLLGKNKLAKDSLCSTDLHSSSPLEIFYKNF